MLLYEFVFYFIPINLMCRMITNMKYVLQWFRVATAFLMIKRRLSYAWVRFHSNLTNYPLDMNTIGLSCCEHIYEVVKCVWSEYKYK